ncbi:SDR family oxidoreductase [Aestuariimicrobium ganziense]|uniref:SDR family oxidoreductase n=1 Tax=Aestuariimicrobium ganziense TaxID=2773677 RepID=UPI0019455598|nr:SDR family oxidoreductase [Aestuariimicrobium ganziense]
MSQLAVLVVGATGSIGRHVVQKCLQAGHATRALVRNPARADLPAGVEVVVGDLTDPASLAAAVDGVDAVVFTHGSDGGGKVGARTVDYGGVHQVLTALGDQPARIALMTAIGTTVRNTSYNQSTESHDWKRRAERLVRASGRDYTIVRPAWFDYNADDQLAITLLQGDTRRSGTPADGAIARRQIAKVLVDSLTSEAANHKTFELVAETGPEPDDLDPLFAALDADEPDAIDSVHDIDNQPWDDEPEQVRAELEVLRRPR